MLQSIVAVDLRLDVKLVVYTGGITMVPGGETCTVNAHAPARAALCAEHTGDTVQCVAAQAPATAAQLCLRVWHVGCAAGLPLCQSLPATGYTASVCSLTRLADRVVTGLYA